MPKVTFTLHIPGQPDKQFNKLLPHQALIEIWKCCLKKQDLMPEWIREIYKHHKSCSPNDPVIKELNNKKIPKDDMLWAIAILDSCLKHKDFSTEWLGLWIDVTEIEFDDGSIVKFK